MTVGSKRSSVLVVTAGNSAGDRFYNTTRLDISTAIPRVNVQHIVPETAENEHNPLVVLGTPSRVVAVILRVEACALRSQPWREWLICALVQVEKRDDFRAYLSFSHEGRKEWQKRLASQEDDLVADTCDTVQLHGEGDSQGLITSVCDFLKSLKDIRDAQVWHRIGAGVDILLMLMAQGALLVAFLAAVVAGVFLLMPGAGALLPVPEHRAEIMSLALGILLIPPQLHALYWLCRMRLYGNKYAREKAKLMLSASLLYCLCTLYGRVEIIVPWLVSGIALSSVLEVIRRNGRQIMGPTLKVFAEPNVPGGSQGLTSLLRVIQGRPAPPFACRILPEYAPRIFISYSRTSSWSSRIALAIVAEAKKWEMQYFVDQHGIPAGASWRRVLNRQLGLANVVLAIIDETTIGRAWPDAEITAALKARYRTGSPEIIVLTKDKYDTLPHSERTPVLTEVVSNSRTVHEPEGLRWIYGVSEDSVAYVLEAIRPGNFQSAGVIPGIVARIVGVLALPFRVVGWFFGTMCVLVAVAIIIAMAFHMASGKDGYWASRLHEYSFILAPFLSYEFAFAARLALASRLEVAHEGARVLFLLNGFATLIIGVAFAFVAPSLNPLHLVWAAVFILLGWTIGADYVRETALSKRGFLRPSWKTGDRQ